MPSASAPVFVVCNARSGSTLLRWLIDAHDEISCPGETDIASLLNAYVDSAQATGLAFDEALVRAGAVVDDLMAAHLAEAGKARWCDKSLSNVTAMDRLAAAWPDARFVLLHRHAMDLIASALEASEWGLDGYGLAPYAQMSPTNGVIAVAGYWIERTAAMLDFEARHPGRCLRLRYEDLVTSTDVSMQGVWNLFGVDGSRRQADAFSGPHDPLAPADHKIWHTHAVNAESIGRGARIPPDRLGVPVRDSMNRLLTMLGYQQVDNFGGVGAAKSRTAKATAPSRSGSSTVTSSSPERASTPSMRPRATGLHRRVLSQLSVRRSMRCAPVPRTSASHSSDGRCVATGTCRHVSGARSSSSTAWPPTSIRRAGACWPAQG